MNPILYWTLRAMLVPFFLVYFRLARIGREHLPRTGPLLLASNHRSFFDPFVIGTLVRRPVYYMAKRELFEKRWQAWVLNALGAFPVDRGAGDSDAMDTARAILRRGDCVVVFPEGTRVRPGPLGEPRRGVGRLALETGAPVAPVAVIGSDAVRRGWRIRPRKVRIRVGRPLLFPTAEHCSPALAAAVTERIWACVACSGTGWTVPRLVPRALIHEAPRREISRAAWWAGGLESSARIGCDEWTSRSSRSPRRSSTRSSPISIAPTCATCTATRTTAWAIITTRRI